jgi:hypothetical protein
LRSTGCATCHWTVKTDIFPTKESNTCSVVVGQHEKQDGAAEWDNIQSISNPCRESLIYTETDNNV